MIMMSDNCVWLSISGDHVKRMDEGLAIGLVRSGEDRSGSKLTTTQESPRTINAIFSEYRSWSVMTCLWYLCASRSNRWVFVLSAQNGIDLNEIDYCDQLEWKMEYGIYYAIALCTLLSVLYCIGLLLLLLLLELELLMRISLQCSSEIIVNHCNHRRCCGCRRRWQCNGALGESKVRVVVVCGSAKWFFLTFHYALPELEVIIMRHSVEA